MILNRLQIERKKAGMRQKDLAEKTGLTQAALSYLEKLRRKPYQYNIDQISKALNIPELYLYQESYELIEALEEIAQGKGRYDPNNYEHAKNTIEDMKEIANNVLKKIKTGE